MNHWDDSDLILLHSTTREISAIWLAESIGISVFMPNITTNHAITYTDNITDKITRFGLADSSAVLLFAFFLNT